MVILPVVFINLDFVLSIFVSTKFCAFYKKSCNSGLLETYYLFVWYLWSLDRMVCATTVNKNIQHNLTKLQWIVFIHLQYIYLHYDEVPFPVFTRSRSKWKIRFFYDSISSLSMIYCQSIYLIKIYRSRRVWHVQGMFTPLKPLIPLLVCRWVLVTPTANDV